MTEEPPQDEHAPGAALPPFTGASWPPPPGSVPQPPAMPNDGPEQLPAPSLNLPPTPSWGAPIVPTSAPTVTDDAASSAPGVPGNADQPAGVAGTGSAEPFAMTPRFTVQRRRRFGGPLGVVIVMLLIAGGAGAFFALRSNNDGGPLSAKDWAARYCTAFDPYTAEGTKLFTTISNGLSGGALSSADTAKKLHEAITGFGEIVQTVLGDITTLTKQSPIDVSGGARLGQDLLDGIGRSQTTIAEALKAIEQLDPATPGYVASAVATLQQHGISLNTRVKVAPSAGLDQLNAEIAKIPNCNSVFEPGAIGAAVASESAATCAADLQTLKLAVQSYIATNTDPPPNADALVPTYLDKKSKNYGFVTSDGKVTYKAEDPACPAPG